MPATSLIHSPWQQMMRSLVNTASSMRADTAADLLDLSGEVVLRNTIKLLQQRYGRIATVLSTIAPFGVLAYVVYYKAQPLLRAFEIVQRLRSYFESSIRIAAEHPMHQLVLSWLEENVKSASTKSMSLQASAAGILYGGSHASNTLDYSSDVKATSFRYNGRTFHVKEGSRTRIDKDGNPTVVADKSVTISCVSFGKYNTAPIRDLLQMVHTKATKSKETLFFRVASDGMRWSKPVGKVTRSMDSIAMQADTKASLIKDITSYLSEESKEWYASVGIPHRRGYLFYGPPGCGKSSVASALAGDFKLQVYSIALSNPALTDDSLEGLVSSLPERALLLLEDVDSAGIERMTVKSGKKSSKSTKRGITLAGLLNVIDGACTSEHRVLCMTSNTPDSLDPALVRPGRIDMNILFGNANQEVMQHMFSSIFADQATSTQHDIMKLAKAFAEQVPEDKVTPAELHNFLLLHQGCPVDAVEESKAWADSLIETKARGRIVAEFTDQIGDVKDTATRSPPAEATSPLTPPSTPDKNAAGPARAPDQVKIEDDASAGDSPPPSLVEHDSGDESDEDDDDDEPEGDKHEIIKELKAKVAKLESDLKLEEMYGGGGGGGSLSRSMGFLGGFGARHSYD